MNRLLIAVAIAFVGLICAEASAQYPHRRSAFYSPYSSSISVNMGGGNYYTSGYSPYGSYSGVSVNLGGGNYYNSFYGNGYNNPYSYGYPAPYYGGYGNPYYGGFGGGY